VRIGHGYDVHAFGDGDKLVLGGVSIPYHHSFIAHSDGDVLIHALIDALLGALALGDIGQHFPDTDETWRGADSRQLLSAVMKLVSEKGYRVGNADITIISQQPKMLPYLAQMKANLCSDLMCSSEQLNIKATTTEGLGFTGRKEGIACHAVALLINNPSEE
jgi:2-C-methyl-D-erythritol 2,4-cyclodiphosphate synthase